MNAISSNTEPDAGCGFPRGKRPDITSCSYKKEHCIIWSSAGKYWQIVSMMTSIFNAETFLDFLKMVLKKRKWRKKLVLILDNARYHHATMIKPWLNTNKKWIKVIFLPQYSPDLNNIERVCKMTRRLCTHNRYFSTLDEWEFKVKKQMKE
jgi:hypothetical protein